MTIQGNDFLVGAGVMIVLQDGTTRPCTGPVVTLGVPPMNDTITCTTPAHTGTVDIRVTNPDGQQDTLDDSLVFQGPPPVSQIVTSTGGTTGGALTGGTGLVIRGSGFANGVMVALDPTGTAAPCNSIAVNAAGDQITCSTTAHGAGSVAIRVQNPDGQFTDVPNAFLYSSAPTVTSISSPTPAQGSLPEVHRSLSTEPDLQHRPEYWWVPTLVLR